MIDASKVGKSYYKKMSSLLQKCYKMQFSRKQRPSARDEKKKKDWNLQGWKNSRNFETKLTI